MELELHKPAVALWAKCGITAGVPKGLLGQDMPTVHGACESWGKGQGPAPEAACLSG